MNSVIRTAVSKKKHRYKADGYNLDLTYITDRLIAMGYPAEKMEAVYRNPMEEVQRFMEDKHPEHYKIYNLCSERVYDPVKFHHRVAHYPFDDHHPPPFELIQTFCQDVAEWLQQDQANIAVVHCKAGKGRTGVMICSFLLHSQVYDSAKSVLEYYGKQRTQNAKGVTIPSQKRYINYYDVSLRNKLTYSSVKMYLRTVVVDYVPNLSNTSDTYYLQFEVHCPTAAKDRPIHISPWHPVKAKDRLFVMKVDPPLLVADDVRIEFNAKPYKVPIPVPDKDKFHFWFNTFFYDKDFTETNLAHKVTISDSTSTGRKTSVMVTRNPHPTEAEADSSCRPVVSCELSDVSCQRGAESEPESCSVTTTTNAANNSSSSSSSSSDTSTTSSSSSVMAAVDKSHKVSLEGPSMSCVDPIRLHRKSSEESVGSGGFVRASSHQSCPNTALPMAPGSDPPFPSFSPERHVSGPPSAPSGEGKGTLGDHINCASENHQNLLVTTSSNSNEAGEGDFDCDDPVITVGSCVLPTSLTSNSSSTNFNKQNSEGCATTTTTTISDELGGLELGSRGAGGGQRRGSQQNCMTKNSSVSDDTLLSRQRGHVTFQEPGDVSSQACGMSDNYYAVEGGVGDLEGYNSYEGCDANDASDVHAAYVNVISRGGHGGAASEPSFVTSTTSSNSSSSGGLLVAASGSGVAMTSAAARTTTHSSFINERIRHSSVPQSASGTAWSSRGGQGIRPPDEGISVSPNNKKHLLSSNNSTSAGAGMSATPAANPSSTAATISNSGGVGCLGGGQASNNNHRDVSSNNVSSSSHLQTQFNYHHTDLTQQHQHQVEGHNISLKLDKQLIDKACKKGGFHPNFEVTLYLIKPDNQSDLHLPSAAAANTATANQHEQKSHDLLGNRSSGDSGSGSTGSGSGNSGGSGSHQMVTSDRFHGMGRGGRDRTLSGHHLGHSALTNSSSVSLMGTGGNSSNHKVSVHRLFPPPSLTKETTSSSPESSSEEEGPHGSSTEGTLQLPASSQGIGGGRVGGSSPTKRRSPHDTNKSAMHTYRVTNNDASLQPNSVDDKHNRHRHHTKNAVPSQSSPLARTDVKATTRGSSSGQAASKAASGQSQQLQQQQQQSKGARLAAPPSGGGARRSNSSVESSNSSRAGAESRPSPALSTNGFGSRLRSSAAQRT